MYAVCSAAENASFPYAISLFTKFRFRKSRSRLVARLASQEQNPDHMDTESSRFLYLKSFAQRKKLKLCRLKKNVTALPLTARSRFVFSRSTLGKE